jgi:acyl CoA:acetate/3-ketoacid CoA transferase alpha subunit
LDILCITGTAPGPISVTVSHLGAVRQVAMEVQGHPAGGWRARHRAGAWGLRCHSVRTAVLLEAAEALADAGAPASAEPALALAAD